MVDHDNLFDSSVAGVTATGMVSVTGVIFYHMCTYCFNSKYPTAQRYLFSIFTMPILIGWISWIELISKSSSKALDFLINLFEAVCLVHFIKYTEKMLGCKAQQKTNSFDENLMLRRLTHNGVVSRIIFRIVPNETIEKAKNYLNKIRWSVYQNVAVLIILGLAGLIAVIITGDWNFSSTRINNLLLIFRIIKAVSAVVAIYALIHFALLVDTIPEVQELQFFHKLITLKLGILFTEIQPIIVQAVATRGGITNTSEYSVEEITAYTNSLLLVVEMVLVACLMLFSFPLDDYKNIEDLKIELSSMEKRFRENTDTENT